jgi:hypothetical protein
MKARFQEEDFRSRRRRLEDDAQVNRTALDYGWKADDVNLARTESVGNPAPDMARTR